MKSGTKSNNATAATANRFRIRTANNNNNNTKNIAASSKRPSSSTGQQQQKRPPLEVYSSNNMNAAGGTSMNDGTCKSANPVNKFVKKIFLATFLAHFHFCKFSTEPVRQRQVEMRLSGRTTLRRQPTTITMAFWAAANKGIRLPPPPPYPETCGGRRRRWRAENNSAGNQR